MNSLRHFFKTVKNKSYYVNKLNYICKKCNKVSICLHCWCIEFIFFTNSIKGMIYVTCLLPESYIFGIFCFFWSVMFKLCRQIWLVDEFSKKIKKCTFILHRLDKKRKAPANKHLLLRCFHEVFHTWRCASMVDTVVLCLSVCSPVCRPSQAGIVPKWLNIGSQKPR